MINIDQYTVYLAFAVVGAVILGFLLIRIENYLEYRKAKKIGGEGK